MCVCDKEDMRKGITFYEGKRKKVLQVTVPGWENKVTGTESD